MRHSAKFHADRSNRGRVMADIRFSKMLAVHHLGFFTHARTNTEEYFVNFCHCAKSVCNQCSTFDDKSCNIFRVKLKMSFHSLKCFLIISPLKFSAILTRPSKATFFRRNASYDVEIVKIGPLVRTRREQKKSAKTF